MLEQLFIGFLDIHIIKHSTTRVFFLRDKRKQYLFSMLVEGLLH